MGHPRFIHYACALALSAFLTGCDNSEMDAASKADRFLDIAEGADLASEDAWVGIAEVVCSPEASFICSGTACTPVVFDDPPVVLRWSPGERRYLRCSPRTADCTAVPVNLSYSGVFQNMTSPETFASVRLVTSGHYVETVAQMTDIYVYHGKCDLIKKLD